MNSPRHRLEAITAAEATAARNLENAQALLEEIQAMRRPHPAASASPAEIRALGEELETQMDVYRRSESLSYNTSLANHLAKVALEWRR